ncbi:sorting nexin [Raphidocelis subcapitata]|uniref:Sorting nexin n=1 Tax=Raphidocelis subcapitata TaxID=307507 RepID=A0A2V0NJR9_9CHLO|nr:sorting nexin [Raphidocelis subcapitata]|eukprot:GBF87488.1 sorting nexin [Raphidocelis subcapitata]
MDPLNPFGTGSAGGAAAAAPGTPPPGPPPPYDSVVMAAAAAGAGEPGPQDFEILVTDPVKQGEGVSAFVSYKVRSRTNLPQYARPSNEVIRRFRDFAWLHEKLAEENRGVIVPPLPEKNAVAKFTMGTDFIEDRRRALQVFINRVASHPALKPSRTLQRFLESNEDEFAFEVARSAAAAGGGAKKRLEGAVGWIKGLGAATTSLVAGKASTDGAEDPEYVKVRDYLAQLESHLGEAARQAGRLVAKETELTDALGEFGQSVEKLGRLEEGNVAEAFQQLASKAQAMSESRRAQVTQLAARFEAPIREAVRFVRAAVNVCTDRGNALAAMQGAKHDLDSKKVRYAKLRGTPGSPSDKLLEAERDVTEAEARVRDTRISYEELVARLTEELNRFQKERAADTNALLRDLALVQASLAADGAKGWSALLSELQAIQGAGGAS